MRRLTLGQWLRRAGVLAVAVTALCGIAPAQTLGEQNAAMGGMDTLNQGSVGPSPGAYMPAPGTIPGTPPGMQPGPGAVPGGLPGMGDIPGAQSVQQVAAPILPKVKVITGTRVFDAVTGELLDDATEKEVPETEKDKYYDDGTHGDVEANDGKYTRVEEKKDAIGQSNQRIKERLVTAVRASEQMNPLEFYGFNLMSTERHETSPRNRVWKIIPDPKGGPGFVLNEEPTDEPLVVPKYRTWQSEKDTKVKEDWAKRFLQEYRQNKDNLTSEFYSMHIPEPPPIPTIRPPEAQAWLPFSDPGASIKADMMTGGMGGMGGEMGMQGSGVGSDEVMGGVTSGSYYK